MDIRVISIGALSSHPLRGEGPGVRVGHGTTVLVRAGKRTILIDPALPASMLTARLEERAGVRAAEVTHVFLTSFNPELRRGLRAFDHAAWWISEREREAVGAPMAGALVRASEAGDSAAGSALADEVAILRRFEAAPDSLATDRGDRVDLFPLPGVTPGHCGLIVAGARHTLVIAGDAVPTIEHLEQGQVLQESADVAQARESFAEALEIADLIIPGRDNLVVNPTKRVF